MEGWIKLHRKISENPLWTCEKFTRGQAWVDLIMIANHSDNYFYKRGIKVEVKRGQCGFSELALSKRWKWSRNKVKKFIKDLEKEHQIEQQKNNVTQIITIVNYDTYQEKRTPNDTPKGHQKDTKRTLTRMNKNEENDKKRSKFKNFEEVVSFFDSRFFDQNKWVDAYDKLIRIDGYDEVDILNIVKEFRSGGNWWKDSGNFNTLLKLRQKNREGVKFIDLFKSKLNGSSKRTQVDIY